MGSSTVAHDPRAWPFAGLLTTQCSGPAGHSSPWHRRAGACRRMLDLHNRVVEEDAMVAPPRRADPQYVSLRAVLRAATQDVHQRLHHHPGFAAVQAGVIDLDAYRALLCRLYGFHQPFEALTRVEAHRTRWLEADLEALGIAGRRLTAIVRCLGLPRLDTPGRRRGALYVVEGATLGGSALAGRLDALLGPGRLEGRRFFHGHGSETGPKWRSFLSELELEEAGLSAGWGEVVDAARETFLAFEAWLADWRAPPHE